MINQVKLQLTPVKPSFDNTLAKDTDERKDFGAFLADALKEVNKLQLNAQEASIKLATGQVDDIAPVVIAAEKASISLQLTMQVRNKVIDAYHEIMRMQV